MNTVGVPLLPACRRQSTLVQAVREHWQAMARRLVQLIAVAAIAAAVGWVAAAAAVPLSGRPKGPSPVVVRTTGRGFDWADAAIGAAAALGLVLAAIGVLVLKGDRNAR
jgi:hypothetical protein